MRYPKTTPTCHRVGFPDRWLDRRRSGGYCAGQRPGSGRARKTGIMGGWVVVGGGRRVPVYQAVASLRDLAARLGGSTPQRHLLDYTFFRPELIAFSSQKSIPCHCHRALCFRAQLRMLFIHPATLRRATVTKQFCPHHKGCRPSPGAWPSLGGGGLV